MYKRPLTFAHFVCLPENRSAWLAVREVADCLATKRSAHPHYNPLLLYGPPGTGKTHLVNALIDSVTSRRPKTTIAQVAAIELGWAGTSDSSNDTHSDLVATLRRRNLVIVEDLQHLPAAAAMPLAQRIDDNLARNRQMVFTANNGPLQLSNRHGKLSRRLASRLAGGLAIRLKALGQKSRQTMLRSLCEDTAISEDAINWLALNLSDGGRQLTGAATQLQILAKEQSPVPLKRVVEHFQATAGQLTVDKITERVSGYFQVDAGQLMTKARHRRVMVPRQVSMYLARQLTELSLQQIGQYFGGRDHSTVLHACKTVEKNLDSDTFLLGAVRQLQAELG